MAFLVTDRQFFQEVVNGPSFSIGSPVNYYRSNAMGKNKTIFDLEISWSSEAELGIPFDIVGNTITRPSGSFLADGFIDGDAIQIVHNAGGTTSSRNITSVNDTILVYDGAAVGDESATDIEIHGVTDLQGAEFTYNLIENNDAFQEPNLQDGSLMQWKVEAIDSPTPGAFKDGAYSANPVTGKTGSWKCKTVTSANPRIKKFQFEHEFRNFPFFLDAERAQFVGDNNINILQNGGSLRYVFRFKAGATSLNPNERKFVFETTTLGNTGGFDETYNGGQPNIIINTIEYFDDASGLQISALQADKKTNVQVVLQRTNTNIDLDADHRLVAYFSKLPVPNDIDPNEDFETNFVIDSLYTTRNAAAVSSTAIENLLVTPGSDPNAELNVNFSVNFNASQLAKLQNGDDFILSFEVDDINNAGLKTTNARTNVNKIIRDNDVSGLFVPKSMGFFRHDMDVDVSDPYTDYKGWDEDQVLLEYKFGLDTALNSKIQDITFRLVAFETASEDYFQIYSQSIDLSTFPVNAGVQQFFLNFDSAYNLPQSTQFRKIQLFNDGTDGTKQLYTFRFPFRLSYMDYDSLPDADGIFFDNTQPNDGLNQKISNYSGKNGYQIKVLIEANCSDDDFANTTLYVDRSPDIAVYDYDEDAGGTYSSASIELLTISEILLPDQEIQRSQDTLVRGTCVFSTPISPTENMNGILRLEKFENGGIFKIEELSSIYGKSPSNLLEPLNGLTLTKVTNNGTNVEFEGRILKDVAAGLPDGQYTISVRPFRPLEALVSGKVTESGAQKLTEAGGFKVIE